MRIILKTLHISFHVEAMQQSTVTPMHQSTSPLVRACLLEEVGESVPVTCRAKDRDICRKTVVKQVQRRIVWLNMFRIV